MELAERVFRVVVCSLLIYGCFEGKLVQIGALNTALSESTNNGGEAKLGTVLLNEDIKERKISKRDVENNESLSVQNSVGPTEIGQTFIITSTRALKQTKRANVLSASPSKVKIDTSPTRKYDGNSSETVAINSQYSTPHTMGASIDGVVTTRVVKSSIHPTSIVSSKILAAETFSELLSRSAIINPAELTTNRPKTKETTPKGESDVKMKKDPNEREQRKTLFGFVTIEILVALLAGAACAVVLLIFLVYRLKKRNEGSYELQESISLKTAAHTEEKEVFV